MSEERENIEKKVNIEKYKSFLQHKFPKYEFDVQFNENESGVNLNSIAINVREKTSNEPFKSLSDARLLDPALEQVFLGIDEIDRQENQLPVFIASEKYMQLLETGMLENYQLATNCIARYFPNLGGRFQVSPGFPNDPNNFTLNFIFPSESLDFMPEIDRFYLLINKLGTQISPMSFMSEQDVNILAQRQKNLLSTDLASVTKENSLQQQFQSESQKLVDVVDYLKNIMIDRPEDRPPLDFTLISSARGSDRKSSFDKKEALDEVRPDTDMTLSGEYMCTIRLDAPDEHGNRLSANEIDHILNDRMDEGEEAWYKAKINEDAVLGNIKKIIFEKYGLSEKDIKIEELNHFSNLNANNPELYVRMRTLVPVNKLLHHIPTAPDAPFVTAAQTTQSFDRGDRKIAQDTTKSSDLANDDKAKDSSVVDGTYIPSLQRRSSKPYISTNETGQQQRPEDDEKPKEKGPGSPRK